MAASFRQRLMMYRKRVDLHCHSRASTEADEAALQAIRCPESYSEPLEIHAQATQRGMDFVTITDHDCIDGVEQIVNLPNVLVGEEVTCYFPEDRCKIHLLVWGITRADHDVLQSRANDIYEIAKYVARNRIAHAVAHPLYRQNGVLNSDHIERLLLLFKGFECLNGAHSMTHREVFEPLLDDLDAMEIRRLERVHGVDALWPQPWIKARTAGSDDHGLFNIGRTWTEFPDDVNGIEDLLECIRECRCRPGGESGSSIKLAHNFYGVGMRYYTREVAPNGGFKSAMIRRILGEKPGCGRIAMASGALGWSVRSLLGNIGRKLKLKKSHRGTELLGQLFAASARKRFDRKGPLAQAFKANRSLIAEHQPIFDLVRKLDRDVCSGIIDAVVQDVNKGKIGGVIDSIATALGHQALLLPYYFALFHQNQERDLLNKMARPMRSGGQSLRVGLFTDEANDDSPAGRFARQFSQYAEARSLRGVVHSVTPPPEPASRCWRGFEPLVDRKIEPLGFNLVIPPILEILEWSDRQQFDAVIVNTFGPMGMCGWLASRMLKAPMLAVCHEDHSAKISKMTGGDYRFSEAVNSYLHWLFRSTVSVLVTSRAGRDVAGNIPGVRIKWLNPSDPMGSAWRACAAAADFGNPAPVPTACSVSDMRLEVGAL